MVAIICDSTCDIPQVLVDKYRIRVVPQYVIWGDEEYRDRVDLQPEAFYQRLVTDETRPTTSQATVGDFLKEINSAVEAGASEVIILTVSSAMSGTYQTAKQAADEAPIQVTVIDSKGPTMTLGWQVIAAARARDEGARIEEVVKKVAEVREKMVQVVAMQTLDYLQTGGRIGDAAKWMGTLLNVKPVVNINHQTGRVEPAGLARTYKSMVNMLYKKFFNAIIPGKKLHIAVLHGDCIEDAQKLAERIREEYNPVELIVNITGPVLGINTGPGALALCGYTDS